MIDRKKLAGLKAAVLCGGPGVEREVSLNSGQAVYRALHEAGFRVEKAVVPETGYKAFLEELDCQVAVMMLHGEFGEDGRSQEVLERRGIAFTGSDSRTCGLAMDKNATKLLFRRCGVPTPDWVVLDDTASALAAVKKAGMGAPLVVKPNARGSSVGVTIVRDLATLPEAVEKALAVDSLVLAERFVAGRELTVGWLDGKILPIIELAPDGTFYDYHAKYLSDKTEYRCPASLAYTELSAVRSVAENILRNIPLRDLARIDIMLGSYGPQALEVNTSPGFTSHSLVPLAASRAGIEMRELCSRLVEMAARRGGLVGGDAGWDSLELFHDAPAIAYSKQRTA